MKYSPFEAADARPAFRTGMPRRALLAAAGMALLLPALSAGTAAADPDTENFIRELGDKAVTQLTGTELSDSERAERFRALLLAHFDVPKIGKYVLGRYWRSATPEEQTEYLALFEDFLVASYSRRFAEYTGEAFEVTSSRPEGDGLELVRSFVLTPNGEKAKLDWILERQDAGLMILDIKIEGLSMSETHRSEFASVIQNSGGKVAGLIDALRKKASGA
jgi:phospholipid transport system substrate-binding protein